ncbi:MAG TPA: glycosyltransferase [Bacteroidota bacterium]|nr:glycosyltransferase [Bacteroidota bacterium]
MNSKLPKHERHLFLYLKTGGGHAAPARAVAAALQSAHPGTVEPLLADGLAESPRFVRLLIEDGYRLLQARARWYYALIYFLNKIPPVAWCNALLVSFFVRPYLEGLIREGRPEKIVIFHFLLIRPVREALRRTGHQASTLVVVTDPFTAHPFWFHDRQQRFIVFSERLRLFCRSRGIPDDHIAVFPFIISDKFSATASADRSTEMKLRIGVDPAARLVLIAGGADGIPNGYRIVRHLLQRHPSYSIAIVCGNNRRLRDRLLDLCRRTGSERLKVFGYVDNIHELLQAADIVITKCGASMCMEILLSNRIPVVSSYLWEQEKGNMEFLTSGEMGIYQPRPAQIPTVIERLFSDPGMLDRMKSNIASLRMESGTAAVADYIFCFS